VGCNWKIVVYSVVNGLHLYYTVELVWLSWIWRIATLLMMLDYENFQDNPRTRDDHPRGFKKPHRHILVCFRNYSFDFSPLASVAQVFQLSEANMCIFKEFGSRWHPKLNLVSKIYNLLQVRGSEMTPEAKCGELYISAILSLQTPDPCKLRLNQDPTSSSMSRTKTAYGRIGVCGVVVEEASREVKVTSSTTATAERRDFMRKNARLATLWRGRVGGWPVGSLV
jgi:hypothetical protein